MTWVLQNLFGENENVIRIMSVHKSKGLEFPIVFLSGAGKQFNMQDLNEQILLDQDMGFGPKYINFERKIEYNTIAKEAIKIKSKTELLSEEMRLLYVALTRAKEKIIFVNKKEQFDETSKRKLFTEFEKQSIASSYDCKCVTCKTDLVDREFEIDHKIPIASGGKNSIENLQSLCKSCHTKKSNFEKFNKSYQKY